MKENLKYVFLLFPIIGIGVLVGGIKFRRRLAAKVAEYSRIRGTVTGNIRALGGRGRGVLFSPVVRYSVGGKDYSVSGETNYSKKPREGATMNVLYDPENPENAVVAKDYYLFPNGLIAIGAVFIVMGSLLCYYLIFASENK